MNEKQKKIIEWLKKEGLDKNGFLNSMGDVVNATEYSYPILDEFDSLSDKEFWEMLQILSTDIFEFRREGVEMLLPINECPYCGSTTFFRKDYMSGSSCYYASSLGEADNSYMHDNLLTTEGKWWYCAECEKRVFKNEEVED
ncbi:hypothetical protein [Enterococcus sp. CSURQ0835]|uniref:hypothetical protein n=1 Tax=Enterococcus sp. CSURQ0835 TaxID=2681394 RepID=UPI00135AF8DC|nr:hypothetical protein [Enterococcus sp. CSURQ0835]